MYATATLCLDRIARTSSSALVEAACPVPFFGDPMRSSVATVGINPSNREFVGLHDDLLLGDDGRLPTLRSLDLDRWGDADSGHVLAIVDACRRYFARNPYDRWFRVLEQLLARAGSSFYGPTADACHLDLIPFATSEKWGCLGQSVQNEMVSLSSDLFGRVLADSPVETVILNGRSVVRLFEEEGTVELDTRSMPEWGLPRSAGDSVPGIAYNGSISSFAGYDLGRSVRVLGFNHNLQSSFGVTKDVKDRIASWLAEEAGRA